MSSVPVYIVYMPVKLPNGMIFEAANNTNSSYTLDNNTSTTVKVHSPSFAYFYNEILVLPESFALKCKKKRK